MTKKYAYKGTNDDRDACEICGKTGLKQVMWLEELDVEGNGTGRVLAMGTTCGAKSLGCTQKEFKKSVKAAKEIIENNKRAAYHQHPLVREAWAIRKELSKNFSGRARMKHPEFIRTRDMMDQVQKEVANMEFSSEL